MSIESIPFNFHPLESLGTFKADSGILSGNRSESFLPGNQQIYGNLFLTLETFQDWDPMAAPYCSYVVSESLWFLWVGREM